MGSLHMPRSGTRYLQLGNHGMAESTMRSIHQHLACRNAGSPQAQGLVRSGACGRSVDPVLFAACTQHQGHNSQSLATAPDKWTRSSGVASSAMRWDKSV